MTHKIKILKSYADAILDHRKTFEVRENDRGYNAGDKIRFRVIEDGSDDANHELNEKEYTITYVHSGLGLMNGYVVFGIREECEELPRPRGSWIKDENGSTVCSICRKQLRDIRIGHMVYCNACGARMEE